LLQPSSGLPDRINPTDSLPFSYSCFPNPGRDALALTLAHYGSAIVDWENVSYERSDVSTGQRLLRSTPTTAEKAARPDGRSRLRKNECRQTDHSGQSAVMRY
jgi:hypothetical protein